MAQSHTDEDVFIFPVSFAQRRLWLIDRLNPGNPAYNIPAVVRFQGPFDVAALERAVNVVVDRHEALRTNILVRGGEPMQAVSPGRPIAVRLLDLGQRGVRLQPDSGGVPDGDPRGVQLQPDDEIFCLVEEETLVPFDLALDPLLRIVVYRLGERDHVVQLTIHHAVADGWSMSILVHEISQAYDAERRGLTPSLPELPIQYGDFAEWQREWLSGSVLEDHLDYWKTQLAQPLAILDLPVDRHRPAAQTYRGASVRFSLNPDTSAAVARLARDEGATPFMVLLAAFKTLLFRYTGQDDVVVGSPIANRGRRELEPLIGFFVNTLVLRSRLSGDLTFRALLRSVKETTLDAYAHQDLPFEHLVDALQPERSLSHTPLFQVLFALQNTPALPSTIADASVSAVELDATAAKFDLSLSLTETPDGLRGAAEYNVDLFDRSTVARLVEHFGTLLASIVSAPDTALGRLPLLSAADRESLARWNQTDTSYPAPFTIHEAFDAQVQASPDRDAVVFEGEVLTYAALNHRANQLAHVLRRRGVGPEVVVGVALERSVEMVVALLAILKAGGAYLPLDPTYPPERIAMMLEDAGASTVLSVRPLATLLNLGNAITICLDEVATDLAREDEADLDARASAGNAAYVIFTSGSTGRPKGAVNTHGAAMNRLRWMIAEYKFDADARVLQKTPFGFDVSVWEFFATLISGGCLIVARPDGHKDPLYLRSLIDAERVTITHFVPSMLRAFVDTPPGSRCPSLRHVVCSGEALAADLRDRFFARFDAALSNLYGPTEAAVDVTCWHAARDVLSPTVPIGYPIANVAMHIVDEAFEPVPVGIAGELLIGGVQVARGYANRPDLTAERFVPDPFGVPGTRVYRTGDRARRLADGSIEFLGRLDFQVKIRGFRVETGEIETRLRERLEVADAVVVASNIAREGRPGDVRLVAYVSPLPGMNIDTGSLRTHLAELLPGYMVPSAFVVLEALPLLPSGKVNRRALPPPVASEAADRTAALPGTATEEFVFGIWRELLGSGHFGVDDNFFTIGGHSLLATQVVSRITDLFRVELPLRVVFERPTVRALAADIDARIRESAGVATAPVTPVPRDRPLRLSFAQQRLWFLNRIEGTSAAYNMPAALRIEGPLDPQVLERTLRALLERHEVLRSRFPLTHGAPVQVIDEEARLTLAVDDLRPLAADAREAAAQRLAAAEFDEPFNVETGPLVRARLVVLDAESHLLLLTTHHIASDGWSTGLLIDDFVRIYGAYVEGRPSPLEPLALQYADFAEWQRNWLTGDVLDRQLAYWKQQLAGAPAVSHLPTDRPRPAVQTFNGDTCTFALGPELSAGVKRLNEQSGSTTFITLLSAFYVLLARWTGQRDFVVGSPSAGRGRRELESVVGFFLNMLPIRADLDGDPGFRSLIERVRHVTLDAYAHQDVPFEQIVDAVEPVRSTSVTPLFQIVFSGAMPTSTPVALPGLRVEPLPPAKVAAKFELAVGIGEFGGAITGAFEYNTDLFDRDTMARMADDYMAIVEAAVAAPDAVVSTLARLSPAEAARVLALGTGTAPSSPLVPIPTTVAAQALRRPDAVAVADVSGSITWSALDGRARALASRLRSLGVGVESVVAMMLPRSTNAIVAEFAVMKAGGAFLPLDPAYPIDRLRYMLADSAARVVVADGSNAAELVAGTDVQVVDVAAGSTRAVFISTLAPLERFSEPRSTWDPASAGFSNGPPEGTPTPEAPCDLDALAYVIYTSGSTGRPKGVEVTHRALASLARWHIEAFGVTATDRMSHVASLSFDASVWEIWPALAAGASVHIPDAATVMSPTALVRWLSVQAVTIAFLPTPLAEQALAADWSGSAIRTLLTGGDLLHQHPAGLPFTLVNNYGPTENAVVASSGPVDPMGDPTGDPIGAGLPSIGTPIAGTRIHLVNERLELVPVGVPGELLIGGASLARGYRGKPDLTAERFIPDSFSGEPGGRLYRTGDLARWRADGTIDFFGRIDRQVKVRGFRIELGEIEAVLAGHPGVTHAAATLVGDGSRAEIVAYAAFAAMTESITPTAPTAPEALRSYLRERLPEHMVPARVVRLDAMPLSGSGKIDYRALPAPGRERGPSTEHAAPRTPTEQLVASIWADQDLQAFGVHDNFFDVGGHSLKLVQVHERLQQALGRAISIVELFQFPTVAALAAHLDAASAGALTNDPVLTAARDRAARQRAVRS